MTAAMEACFYRGIDPTEKCYSDLRYWLSVHEKIVQAEIDAANAARKK